MKRVRVDEAARTIARGEWDLLTEEERDRLRGTVILISVLFYNMEPAGNPSGVVTELTRRPWWLRVMDGWSAR